MCLWESSPLLAVKIFDGQQAAVIQHFRFIFQPLLDSSYHNPCHCRCCLHCLWISVEIASAPGLAIVSGEARVKGIVRAAGVANVPRTTGGCSRAGAHWKMAGT